MDENKSILLRSAMSSGLSMGIFWCIKYIFFMLGLSVPAMSFVYLTFSLFVPLVALIQTWLYRMRTGGSIRFFHAWQFGVLLYFFAALIVSLEHYVFYQYIAPPGFLSKSMDQVLEILESANASQEMIDTLGNTRISPIQMTIQGIFNNVFYGVIFSLPVAWAVSRWKEPWRKENKENDSTDQTE